MLSRGTFSKRAGANGGRANGSSRGKGRSNEKNNGKIQQTSPGKQLIQQINGQAKAANEILDDGHEQVSRLDLGSQIKRGWESKPDTDYGADKKMTAVQDTGTAEASVPAITITAPTDSESGSVVAFWEPDEESRALLSNQASLSGSVLLETPITRARRPTGSAHQLSGTARKQQKQEVDSPVLKIDNINAAWNEKEVTEKLFEVLSRHRSIHFGPDQVTLLSFPQEVNNTTMIRLLNPGRCKEAARIVNTTKLNGNIPVRAHPVKESSSYASFLKGRIQLDNVDKNWTDGVVTQKVKGVMRGTTGYLVSAKKLPQSRYPDSSSYILTFDFPSTAEFILRRLACTTLNGPKFLEATILPRT